MGGQKVELRPAYAFDCPECGREVFVRGLVLEMSAKDLEALREEAGLQESERGDFMMMPVQVTCNHCGGTFGTVHFRGDDLSSDP